MHSARLQIALCAGALFISLGTALPAFGEEAKPANEWPQWRGPSRDGIIPVSPKLLERWPASGPQLLWKAPYDGATMAGKSGGSSSPVVAGGKVVLFANPRPLTPKKILTAEYLDKWGWNPNLPADLVKKVETERQKHNYDEALFGRDAKPEALDAYVKAYLQSLDPALVTKFGPTLEKRLRFRYDFAWSWGTLEAMSKNMDTEFKVSTEFEKLYESSPMHHNDVLNREAQRLLSQLAEKSLDIFICLDASTGKELWKKEFPGRPGLATTFAHWPSSATPAIADGRCYATGSAGVYCLSMADGSLLWKNLTFARTENSSPLVANGRVCVVVAQGLTALDAATGKECWKANLGGAGDWGCSVTPWVKNGKTYLITCDGYCVDVETGKTVWAAAENKKNCGGVLPAISGDTAVFFGGRLAAYKLSVEKADVLWVTDNWGSGDRVSSPIIYNDHVYAIAMGGTRCADLKTGTVCWQDKTHHTMFPMPVLADGMIIASIDAGSHAMDNNYALMFCYRASADKFEELGKMPVEAHLAYCSSAAVVNGRMYLHLEDGVACYELTAR